jgi:hypothetical protein
MRMHDLLMTETPRPYLGDEPYKTYAVEMEKAVVIEATDVSELLMEMTSFSEEVREDFEDFGADNHAWQIAQFFNFDYTSLSNIAPPFEEMLFEFDTRDAIERLARSQGKTLDPKATINVGKTGVMVLGWPGDMFTEVTNHSFYNVDKGGTEHTKLLAIANDPDLGWVLCIAPFHYIPGKGLVGPMCHFFVPVRKDGSPYLDNDIGLNRERIALWSIMSPAAPRDRWDDEDNLPQRSAAAQGWQAVVPTLMAINLMHTPRGEKGYHYLKKEEPQGRLAKKFLAKHFRPMTSWHVLDISPLREAVRQANGGEMPRTMKGLVKALHVVRGHYAHYPPNTYFGRKHDEWITVFRPSFRRGDIAAGRVDKDYRVGAES